MASKQTPVELDPTKVPIGHGLFAQHLLLIAGVLRANEKILIEGDKDENTTALLKEINMLLDSIEACLHNAGGAYYQETGDGKKL